MFKIIGVIAGFFTGGFLGAIFGFLIGSFIDRSLMYGIGGVNPLSRAHRESVFLSTAFLLMGKIAKADGRVSEEEIAHVENLFQKLGMGPDHRQQAITLFKKGVEPDFEIKPVLDQFMAACGHTSSLRQMLLVYLIVMAFADGQLDPAEEAILRQVAQRLGYSDESFRQIMAMVINQTHFAGSQAASNTSLEDAYKALGVSKDSTDQEIKRAYRKLMSQYHPDKLMGQGLPEDMIKLATAQAQEVQTAYNLIKNVRNLH